MRGEWSLCLPQFSDYQWNLCNVIPCLMSLVQVLAKADGLKACGEDSRLTNDILDTELQTAFLKFLLAPDMLGNVMKHMYIIRLFPRPTVSLKSHSFSNEYHTVAKQQAEGSAEFIQRIISSQVSCTYIVVRSLTSFTLPSIIATFLTHSLPTLKPSPFASPLTTTYLFPW